VIVGKKICDNTPHFSLIKHGDTEKLKCRCTKRKWYTVENEGL